MTLVTLSIGTIAAAFVAGYELGYGQALHDYDYANAIPKEKTN